MVIVRPFQVHRFRVVGKARYVYVWGCVFSNVILVINRCAGAMVVIVEGNERDAGH